MLWPEVGGIRLNRAVYSPGIILTFCRSTSFVSFMATHFVIREHKSGRSRIRFADYSLGQTGHRQTEQGHRPSYEVKFQ
jgi:hypothetical protein